MPKILTGKALKKRTIQQQHLLAFSWVDGIADYNVDYAKVKEKKYKAAYMDSYKYVWMILKKLKQRSQGLQSQLAVDLETTENKFS